MAWFTAPITFTDGSVLNASDLNSTVTTIRDGIVTSLHGGFGISTASSTGVPSVSSGTWSIGTRLGASLGGTNIDTSGSTGVPSIAAGVWSVATDLAFANLAQGAALSVLGVTGNATADVASIAAGADNDVLRRSGTAVAFGTIAAAAIGSGTVATARLGSGTADATTFLRGDQTYAAPAAGAITFAGSDTTERTTTSTTSVTLSTITVTSIPTTSGILILIPWRHTTGAVEELSLGVTLNATAYMPAVPTAANANAAQNGVVMIYIPPYDTVYLNPWAVAVNGGNDVVTTMYGSIARPNAAITSILIVGLVGSASITGGIQNVMIYAVAGS